MVTNESLACCRYYQCFGVSFSPIQREDILGKKENHTSVGLGPPNFSIGKGEPKPLVPAGGNFADWTSFLASSAVYKRGTMMPWAAALVNRNAFTQQLCSVFVDCVPPESSARLTIQPSLAAIRTTGLTPHAAIAATASCIALSSDCQCPAGAGSVLCDTSQWLCYHRCFHAPCLPRPSQNHNVLDYGFGVSLACLRGYDEPWNTSREWKLPRHVSRIKISEDVPMVLAWLLPGSICQLENQSAYRPTV